MTPVNATPEKQDPAQHGEGHEPDAENTQAPNKDPLQKTPRKDADSLPDGSGDDSQPSQTNQGQESGEQTFSAG